VPCNKLCEVECNLPMAKDTPQGLEHVNRPKTKIDNNICVFRCVAMLMSCFCLISHVIRAIYIPLRSLSCHIQHLLSEATLCQNAATSLHSHRLSHWDLPKG
jgi:hypothetical protein